MHVCICIILYTWCLSAGDKLNDLLEKIASSLKRESVAYHSVHMTFDFTKYLLQIIACVNSLKVSDSCIAPVIRDIYEHEVNGVLKRGYLVKKGAKRKNWKRRWFVLKSDEMSYYESYETMILKVHIIYLCMYYTQVNSSRKCMHVSLLKCAYGNLHWLYAITKAYIQYYTNA